MLKTRLVGVLIIRDDIVVQSINFNQYLPVGSPSISVDYLDQWGIDEIIVLNISPISDEKAWLKKITEFSQNCHVPMTIGGGIRSIDLMKKIIHSGADKVAINTAVYNDFGLISEGAKLFGEQCIVVSIDAKKVNDHQYRAYANSGKLDTQLSPVDVAKKAESSGAGEIFINSIDRDGRKNGLDKELATQVGQAVNIPVVICGGVGHPDHFVDGFSLDVSGVAASNIFHYSEHAVTVVKNFLKQNQCNVRLDSYVNYGDFDFDELGRVSKMDDDRLEKLRFEYIPEEII